MSMIDAVQSYIKTYSFLIENAPVWVDYIGNEPTQYAISPLPGARITETNIDDSTTREFMFAFEMVGLTVDDVTRLQNLEFFEVFAKWLEAQSKIGILPTLATGETPEKIQALGWGYLFDNSESGTGVYQIQCKLIYSQVAP